MDEEAGITRNLSPVGHPPYQLFELWGTFLDQSWVSNITDHSMMTIGGLVLPALQAGFTSKVCGY